MHEEDEKYIHQLQMQRFILRVMQKLWKPYRPGNLYQRKHLRGGLQKKKNSFRQ